jgi:hypothetical protein
VIGIPAFDIGDAFATTTLTALSGSATPGDHPPHVL